MLLHFEYNLPGLHAIWNFKRCDFEIALVENLYDYLNEMLIIYHTVFVNFFCRRLEQHLILRNFGNFNYLEKNYCI